MKSFHIIAVIDGDYRHKVNGYSKFGGSRENAKQHALSLYAYNNNKPSSWIEEEHEIDVIRESIIGGKMNKIKRTDYKVKQVNKNGFLVTEKENDLASIERKITATKKLLIRLEKEKASFKKK